MENKDIKLHGYWRSGCSWRLRTILNLKGIEYEYIPVNLVAEGGMHKKPEFAAMNPAQMVPVLEIDGHTMTESMPICEYLEETRPEARKLWPEGAYDRFQVRRLCEIINSGTQPI